MTDTTRRIRLNLGHTVAQNRRWRLATEAQGLDDLHEWIRRTLDAASEPYARAAQEPGGKGERS